MEDGKYKEQGSAYKIEYSGQQSFPLLIRIEIGSDKKRKKPPPYSTRFSCDIFTHFSIFLSTKPTDPLKLRNPLYLDGRGSGWAGTDCISPLLQLMPRNRTKLDIPGWRFLRDKGSNPGASRCPSHSQYQPRSPDHRERLLSYYRLGITMKLAAACAPAASQRISPASGDLSLAFSNPEAHQASPGKCENSL